MVQQGVPLLVQLKQMVLRGEWLGYTALDAGGMQFYGVFFFFLSNPFSFLVLLTDLRADQLVGLLTAAKMALSAGTAAFWLRKHNPKLSASLQILLGMMYGCCGYGFFYYQNLMWLDVMALFPLLLWGLERLFRQQKPAVYCIILCAVMVSCFYLCYMAALFILLYGALSLRFTVPPEQRRKTALSFFVSSLFAACITAPVWIPCFLQVSRSARTGSAIGSLMASLPLNHAEDKLALLFCTGLTLAALPHLLKARKLHTAGRYARGSRLFLLLSAAMLLDPINAMWHTGSYQAFPFRWGMFPVMLLLGCAADLLSEPQELPAQKPRFPDLLLCSALILCTWCCTVLVLNCAGDGLFGYIRTLWVSMEQFLWLLLPAAAAFAAYYLIIRLRRKGRLGAGMCTLLMFPLFLSEATLSFHCYAGNSGSDDALFAQTLKLENAVSDPDFFRVNIAAKYLHPNMLGAVGYPTIAHYTSLTRDDFLHGIKRFGYSSYWMEVTGCGGTALSDALWANRWQVGASYDLPPWRTLSGTADSFVISKSSIALPTVLYTDKQPAEIAVLPDGTRSQVQAYLAETLLGAPDLITEYEPVQTSHLTLTHNENGTEAVLSEAGKDGIIEYSGFIHGQQALYFDLSSHTDTQLSMPYYQSVTVSCNGKTVSSDYPQKGNNGLMYLGTAEDSFFTVRVQVHKDFSCESFGVFGMDIDGLRAAAARAEGTEFSYQNGVYTADCTLASEKTLIFSAAYDEGFTAEIDGTETAVFRVNDCELAVRVPAGTHQVRLTHHIGGMRPALCLAGFGAVFGAVWLFVRKRLSAAVTDKLGTAAAAAFRFAYWGVLIAVYFLPMLLCLIGAIGLLFGFY